MVSRRAFIGRNPFVSWTRWRASGSSRVVPKRPPCLAQEDVVEARLVEGDRDRRNSRRIQEPKQLRHGRLAPVDVQSDQVVVVLADLANERQPAGERDDPVARTLDAE